MSKYTPLTNTIGIDMGTVVYRPSHSGMSTYVVIAIDRVQNAIGTVYKGWWDRATEAEDEGWKQQLRLQAEGDLQTVTAYYSKHIPKPRKKQGPNYEIAVPPSNPAQPTRTPDMYDFD